VFQAFKLAVAIAGASVALGLLGTAATAAPSNGWNTYYCCHAWFTPGEGHTSAYDSCTFLPTTQGFWVGDWIYKSDTALSTLALIDKAGNWIVSDRAYNVNHQIYISPYNWTKKAYCKNSSTVGYSATCWAYWTSQDAGCV
jgi:hypothetical protein